MKTKLSDWNTGMPEDDYEGYIVLVRSKEGELMVTVGYVSFPGIWKEDKTDKKFRKGEEVIGWMEMPWPPNAQPK